MPDIPSGTVTFLFTDIEQSTRSWEDNASTMEAALARHDAIVRGRAEDAGGFVFSATGDGFGVAFGQAGAAAKTAVEIQAALRTEAWPEGLALNVRMGVHTGDAQERDNNYFGPTLNRAARIMDAAHGGQVLVSDATAVSLEQDRLLDLGRHWLKDLPTRERLWQLDTGTDQGFPPPRTLGSGAATNVGPPDEELVGREDDVREVREMLDDARLVTIVGVGGVGKTRLALDVARTRIEDFDDGVWLCELAPLGEPEAVASALATVVGARQHPGRTMAESVAEFCRQRSVLIVLDNCEHVLDAAGELADALLAAAPNARILATSREALGCRGERAYPARSLAADGEQSAAVQLFVRRAEEVARGRTWDAEERSAIARICARLDGMPLAIELAAGRVRSLSPVEIESRLDSAFRVLRGGRRSLERHRTLEAAIDWSYRMLDEASAALFQRLAVFAGGWDLEAAEAVCADGDLIDELDVAELLDELVVKSLVVADYRGHRSTRYRLLEPLRQYAENLLADNGDGVAIRDQHADYYRSLLERWGIGPDEHGWRRMLEDEFANVRTAVTWAVDARNADCALRIVVAIDAAQAPFLLFEIGDWANAATALDEAFEHPLGPEACRSASASFWWRGDMAMMKALIDRAESMPHYSPTAFQTNQIKAMYLFAVGEVEAAVMEINRVDTTHWSTAVIPWWRCGMLPEVRLDDVELLRSFERETDSTILGIMADQSEAGVAIRTGDPVRAEELTRRAIENSRELGTDYFHHLSIPVLAVTAGFAGTLTNQDLEDVRDALRVQRDRGSQVDQWLVLLTACVAVLQDGRRELAEAIMLGLDGSPWRGTPLVAGVEEHFFAATVDYDNSPSIELADIVDRTLPALDEILAARAGD